MRFRGLRRFACFRGSEIALPSAPPDHFRRDESHAQDRLREGLDLLATHLRLFVAFCMASDATDVRALVEQEAEYLVVSQLDLLAQLERQLRSVHQTMRRIETLRSAKDRVGGELSNGEKIDTLDHLTEELAAIDHELQTQHESCHLMLETVAQMRERLRQISTPAATTRITRKAGAQPPGSVRARRRRT